MKNDEPQPGTPQRADEHRDPCGLSRRAALKTGILAGAGVASAGATLPSRSAAPPTDCESDPETKNMHLSLAAYSMRDALESGEMNMFEFVDWCAEMGLSGTELTSYFFEEGFDADYLHRLRGEAFHRGVSVSGTAIANNFCLPPGPKKQKQIAKVKQWIDHAAELFAPHIRIFAGSLPEGTSRETGIEWVADGIEKVLGYAQEQGIVLGLENHGSFTGELETHLAICEEVGDSPWFGINLDTGNYLTKPYYSLAKAAPHAVNVQLKANVAGNDGTEEAVDLDRIKQILVEADYKGWVVLEYEKENPRETIPKFVEELKRLY
jgi:sugar phosphate isomerase/epimerase